MIIVMKKKADEKELENIIKWMEGVGYKAHVSKGVERTRFGLTSKASRSMSG